MTGGSDIVSYSWNAGDKEVSRSEKFTVSDDLLGKTIYVIVTDSEGNIATSEETAPVTGEAIVSEVTLDNVTPAVGDKITASAFDEEGNDVSAQCTWQWFRVTAEGNVVTISNATKQSYTVGAIDRGAVLYCEATDSNGNLLKSNESSVMKATNITEINVNGMTGQRPGDKDEFVAIAGDELEVELVPYGAANDASYQWYRGGAAIKGATEKTYVPTTADVNLPLSVKVSIPNTAGYGISEDATTTNATLVPGTTVSGATYSLTAVVELDDVVCWDLSNSTPLLDNTKPAVGDTLTVKVPFDKNGDGDEKDTGDYLDLTSDEPDATVVWYRGSIEAKNKVGEGASYDVVKDDNGKALYAKVTGAPGTEFIGSCEATTDEANKTVMNTEISRETDTVTVTTDMVAGDAAMTKGTTLYASTKDNNSDSVKDANLTFQWYRGGAAIDGATSSSYTLGDDDIKKFKDATNNIVTYRVVVNGKDGYTGSAKDTIDIKGAISTATKKNKEDISVKRGDYYLYNGSIVNAGDTLTLAASYADSLNAMNVIWWYSALGDGSDAEQFTGTSFTVPSTAGTAAKIAVSLTKKADPGMWSDLDFTLCTTNTTDDTQDPKKTSSLTVGLDAGHDNNRVIYANNTTVPANWTALTTTNKTKQLSCAKALDSIAVSFKVGDRTLDAPEVGAKMTVTVTPQLADLTYKWTSNGTLRDSGDNDDPATATDAEAGEGANTYTITSADINNKIKVEVTAGAASTTYAGAKISYESEAVAQSSRTIAAVKVLKYSLAAAKGTATDTWYVDENDASFLNDKKDFVNKKSVSAIATNERYIIVALDSDGELVNDEDADYNLYNFKSGVEKKVGSAQIFYAGAFFTAGDIAHFEVAPNQIGYTGSAASYNLTSAVSENGGYTPITEEIEVTIAPTTGAAATDYNADDLLVASDAALTFTATVAGVDGSPTIKWYDETGTAKKVGKTFNPIGTITAGKGFYAEITVNGTAYSSEMWTVATRAATTFAIVNDTAAALALDDAFSAVDQFGAVFDLKTTPTTTSNVTYTAADTNITAVTVTGASGTTANLEKITVAATGGTLATGDEITFELGEQTFQITMTGATTYTLAEVSED